MNVEFSIVAPVPYWTTEYQLWVGSKVQFVTVTLLALICSNAEPKSIPLKVTPFRKR